MRGTGLTVREAAREIGCRPKEVVAAIRRGALPAERVSGHWEVGRAEAAVYKFQSTGRDSSLWPQVAAAYLGMDAAEVEYLAATGALPGSVHTLLGPWFIKASALAARGSHRERGLEAGG